MQTKPPDKELIILGFFVHNLIITLGMIGGCFVILLCSITSDTSDGGTSGNDICAKFASKYLTEFGSPVQVLFGVLMTITLFVIRTIILKLQRVFISICCNKDNGSGGTSGSNSNVLYSTSAC